LTGGDASASADTRVAVAYVHRAKGVRGEVKAELFSADPTRLGQLGEVVVQKAGQPDRPLRLVSCGADAPGVRIKFAGVDSPEQAREWLVGGYLTVRRDQVPPLPEGSYYEFDLMGCCVADETGQVLGLVAEVHHLPTLDAYRVVGAAGEFMLPAVSDFVVSVDIGNRRLVVRGVDELLAAG
jgi:16S rRNA processing protein RimM